MQDLRLVGVHDDGQHLLLSGAGGEIYRLRIDEALRVASSRTTHRGGPSVNGETETPRLSPRDIQQRIRGGASAQEVAEASGVPLEHVQRYEGPVLAEREYVAQQAQRVQVADALPNHDGYRSAFGDDPASLGDMVSHRLTALGINPDTAVWDAWRRSDGSWTVTADFDAEAAKVSDVGESAPAQWIYHTARKSVQNANRWAQLLSEIAPLDSPVPARRLSAVADRPFDVETDSPELDEETVDAAQEAQDKDAQDSETLLDLLRSRRGQRLGVAEEEDDALALMLSEGVPAAHPRPGDLDAVEPEEGEANTGSQDGAEQLEQAAQQSFFPPLSLAPAPAEQASDGNDDPLGLFGDVSTETREISIPAHPAKPSQNASARSEEAAEPGSAEETPEPAERRAPIKPKRSSVPSWDEIVFGTKSDS
ncbi:hypothetical protein FHU41_000270 [Psychromicrobium silvestre]|uniref:DUF3071 domain-containing protein n=1 Tax=Psychromicrobium silvestre TaxID=1645614 RepID=A0A7Y9LR39_9MICC|nr:septation protein SepH [Psychromicrobium silvestre]NYE94049.1 hypothetical protein [Psychromicrobium silvestre]